MRDFHDVIILGAGAAGIGAGRRLASAGMDFLVLEGRDRIGGRALTIERQAPLDLGCGWLHSAERNPMTAIAAETGFQVDRTPAPWQKQSGAHGMSAGDQAAFAEAFRRFERRIDEEAERRPPAPASAYLESGNRWNALLDAVFSYISGASLDRIDARDYARYEDTGCNWRVRQGYGALIAALGAGLPVACGVEALAVDHGAARIRVETARGTLECRALIVTLPTTRLERLEFRPSLPGKQNAAQALPLGAAEKVHFRLSQAEEFPSDGHLFARTDTPDTGSYHLRPMGRPLIEVYFGGALARGLAEAGEEAMADFARQELAGLLGSAFPARLTRLATTSWATDVFSMGAYSYAKPGSAEERAVLAAPIDDRLFFAGEACSRARYSTAHGAFETGCDAAEAALAALQLSPSPRA